MNKNFCVKFEKIFNKKIEVILKKKHIIIYLSTIISLLFMQHNNEIIQYIGLAIAVFGGICAIIGGIIDSFQFTRNSLEIFFIGGIFIITKYIAIALEVILKFIRILY